MRVKPRDMAAIGVVSVSMRMRVTGCYWVRKEEGASSPPSCFLLPHLAPHHCTITVPSPLTMDNAFRKLDVDQYSEDRVLPTDLYTPDSRSASQVLSATQSKLTAVRSFLQRGEMAEALGEVLKAPPFGEGVDDSKVSLVPCLLRYVWRG
jgi:hypothetical protein